ncbi:hypothetical protein ABID22_003257 [Pontibacter aydingkolensis]|uniref:Uncharacterized protein n=1 Tax=Pontibacter aydingkolensis TaxID=1911536 RepID=A0ABS7CSB2_9BACT|nr:hypothetical protein [Pontibacter aydingkolensis]MBW7466665.1 hypothetical protein [Pontibacter aydingkolensis]
MKELDRLKEGLVESHVLLYKNEDRGLTCSFVKEGLVVDSFTIKDNVLAQALSEKGTNGIVEGINFQQLRNNYDWFSLSVKTKKLYEELK